MPPTFTFCVPTHREDRPLKRCLDSIATQLEDGDEVIVVGDTLEGELPGVEALVNSYGSRYRYTAHNAGHHCWGHCQLNAGLAQAQGEWLHCNDDDDVWVPGAVKVMRKGAAESEDRPLLFRFISYQNTVYWLERGVFAYERLGGHCLVARNLPGQVGKWEDRYQGDWDYVNSTVQLQGGEERIIWRDEIICVARPSL